ncbi:unnamed protein product [Oikopleura dioica]|uniref:P-type domain-containing protein n=1 Tax=Oikopleura dioica TaxID=34765 RepID=E4XFL0_OIKDI|nr:unnamed protein product [Oikopleura dioica]
MRLALIFFAAVLADSSVCPDKKTRRKYLTLCSGTDNSVEACEARGCCFLPQWGQFERGCFQKTTEEEHKDLRMETRIATQTFDSWTTTPNDVTELKMKYDYVTRFWDRVWLCLQPLIFLGLVDFIRKSL